MINSSPPRPKEPVTVDLPAKSEPKRRRPLQVAEAIKSWVVERGLRRGDRLPGEAEMITRFGMSKSTIREAMRILEAQGLVETRTGPGGGSFVGEVTEERARALLGNYFYFKGLSIDDIYALRELLEPELAASLAGTLTDAQLADLDALVAAYDNLVLATRDDWVYKSELPDTPG